jgi:hypothetical protein
MKLTLRELFLLVALAAMGCGWWVDRWRLTSRERLAKETLYKASNANAGFWEPIWEGKFPPRDEVPEEERLDRSIGEIREERLKRGESPVSP